MMEGAKKPVIFLFTDGSSSGNPGPGGYGAILKCGGKEKELVIVGLETVKWKNAEIVVVSDSSYVVNSVMKGWVFNWEKKGFAKAKNPDLWIRFLKIYRQHKVTFRWIKGHSGHPENERCDAMAVAAGAGAAAAGKHLPDDTGYLSLSAKDTALL